MHRILVISLTTFTLISPLSGCQSSPFEQKTVPAQLTDDQQLSDKLLGSWSESCDYTDNKVVIYPSGKIALETAGKMKFGSWWLKERKLTIHFGDKSQENWELKKVNNKRLIYAKGKYSCRSSKIMPLEVIVKA